MKKTIRIVLAMLILIGIATVVNATDTNIILKPEKEKVEQGSEVKVQLIIKDFGRTGKKYGIEGKLLYEAEKLENVKVINKSNWDKTVSEDGTGLVFSKSEAVGKDEVIAEITFKAKETAELGKTKVTLSKINTSTDGDEIEINNIETEMEIVKKEEQTPPDAGEKTLTSIEITNLPTKTTYTEGEKYSTAGMKVTAKYSDGTSKEITNYTFSPYTALKTTDKKIVISYTEGKETVQNEVEITVKARSTGNDNNNHNNTVNVITIRKDNTVADKEYPKTGAERIVLPIILLAVISGTAYIINKKYKKI